MTQVGIQPINTSHILLDTSLVGSIAFMSTKTERKAYKLFLKVLLRILANVGPNSSNQLCVEGLIFFGYNMFDFQLKCVIYRWLLRSVLYYYLFASIPNA